MYYAYPASGETPTQLGNDDLGVPILSNGKQREVVVTSSRMRLMASSVLSLIVYWFVFRADMDDLFLGRGSEYALLLASLVVISALIFAPRRPVGLIVWGVFSPFLASAISYGILATIRAIEGAHFASTSIYTLAVVGLSIPYMVCRVWALSCGLVFFGLAAHYVFPTRIRSAN